MLYIYSLFQLHKHGNTKRPTSFNLYVCVKNFVCRTGEDADLYMTLYDAKKNECIRLVVKKTLLIH